MSSRPLCNLGTDQSLYMHGACVCKVLPQNMACHAGVLFRLSWPCNLVPAQMAQTSAGLVRSVGSWRAALTVIIISMCERVSHPIAQAACLNYSTVTLCRLCVSACVGCFPPQSYVAAAAATRLASCCGRCAPGCVPIRVCLWRCWGTMWRT